MVTVASVPVGEFVRDALQNLNAQRQRSALALLGVMIGTASIVALMTIGHMAQRETLKLFADTGIDIVQVSASPVGEEPAVLDQAVVEALPATDPDILASAPLAIGNSKASLDAAETDVGVVGVTAVLPSLAGLTMAEGRFLAPLDSGQTVAVIGAEVATKLAANGVSARVGQAVRIGAYGFVVVGVLAPRAYTAFDPTDFNNAVLVPMATGVRVMDRPAPATALLRVREGADTTVAGERAMAALATPAAALRVQTAGDMIRTMNAQRAVQTRFLLAIGAISLLVGGIGVMNVMLMGIIERRREIGIRAAIGATPRAISLMFLVEAAALTLIGGLGGLMLGLMAAAIMAAASGWSFSVAPYILLIGPGMALGVGLGFGVYPAVKASRLDPIEALRAE